jgi:hypothetical protein
MRREEMRREKQDIAIYTLSNLVIVVAIVCTTVDAVQILQNTQKRVEKKW